jgi:hypothetical protein
MRTVLLLMLVSACGRSALEPGPKVDRVEDAGTETPSSLDAYSDLAQDVHVDTTPGCILSPTEVMFSSIECGTNLSCGLCWSTEADGAVTHIASCYVANGARLCVVDCTTCK